MNKSQLDIAKAYIAERKAYNDQHNSLSHRYMMENDTDFRALYTLNCSLVADYAKARFSGIDPTDIGNQVAANNIKLRQIAAKRGIEIDKFDCAICNDSGYLDDGCYCSCLRQKYNYIIKAEAYDNNDILDFHFHDNNLAAKSVQHDKLTALYNSFAQYADKFPNNQKKHVLLSGKTGVGKSCLLSAIANTLLSRGFYLIYMNAFKLNNMLLQHHIGKLKDDGKFIESLISCDALFIDDLGSEPAYDNVTLNYLYMLLEERRDKYLFISTNLSNDELLKHYGSRIHSRLTLTQSTFTSDIEGNDLRNFK